MSHKTNDEWCEIRLQTEYPLFASVELKIDFARLKDLGLAITHPRVTVVVGKDEKHPSRSANCLA